MSRIYEHEYKILRQYILLIVSTMIIDEEYKLKWYTKIYELDKNIDMKREKTLLNRGWNSRRTNRVNFKKFEGVLDFS